MTITSTPPVIGLLGGMSWQSSAQYYRLLNEIVGARPGGLHSARCLLASVDFADIEALQAAGRWEVGLLGTAFTMEQDYYRERLAAHGLDVLVPEPEDRAVVHRIIYDELCHGVVTHQSRRRYQDVIARMAERGAAGVILGCTEIELLISTADSPLPVFPTTRLHVEAAIDLAYGPPPSRAVASPRERLLP